MKKEAWNRDRIQEMDRWRRSNEATVKETAEHFGVDYKKYLSARGYWGGKKAKIAKPKKTNAPKVMEFEVAAPVSASLSKIAVFVMPQSQVKDFIGALWQ